MNILTQVEGAVLHALGAAIGADLAKATAPTAATAEGQQGAGGIAGPLTSPDSQNIIAQLEAFGIDLATGAPAKIAYKLPAEKYQTTFQWEGRTWNFTAEVVNGVLHLDAIPQ